MPAILVTVIKSNQVLSFHIMVADTLTWYVCLVKLQRLQDLLLCLVVWWVKREAYWQVFHHGKYFTKTFLCCICVQVTFYFKITFWKYCISFLNCKKKISILKDREPSVRDISETAFVIWEEHWHNAEWKEAGTMENLLRRLNVLR